MQFEKLLFLKKSISLISAVYLVVFGGVTVTPVRAQDYYHYPNCDQVQEFYQSQEYRRVQKLCQLQKLRRIQNQRRVEEFQQSPEVHLNLANLL